MESFPKCMRSDYECVRSYTACQPIDLVVQGLPSDANDIGLREQAIIDAAESRLRSARIYDPDAWEYFHVNINVTE